MAGYVAAMTMPMEIVADDLDLDLPRAEMLRRLVFFVGFLVAVLVTLGAIPILALTLLT
jgi:hypothetical protein